LYTKTSAVVEKLLFDLNKKMNSIMLIVTHDKDLAAQCDIQVHLKDGVVEKVSQKRKVTSRSKKQTKASPQLKKRRVGA